jgi:hypothetical protein
VNDESLECAIRLHTDLGEEDVARQVALHLPGELVRDRMVLTDICRVVVTHNPARNDLLVDDPEEGFLRFRHIVEVDPLLGAPRESYIEVVGHLLRFFWGQGWRAVAVCDYDTELPDSGGYREGREVGH